MISAGRDPISQPRTSGRPHGQGSSALLISCAGSHRASKRIWRKGTQVGRQEPGFVCPKHQVPRQDYVLPQSERVRLCSGSNSDTGAKRSVIGMSLHTSWEKRYGTACVGVLRGRKAQKLQTAKHIRISSVTTATTTAWPAIWANVEELSWIITK